MNDSEYEKKVHEKEEELKSKLTDAFLEVLVEAVRTCGWAVDWTESATFVEWCFSIAEKPTPDLKPYNDPLE